MVLVEVRKGDQVIGRCDAKCYTAESGRESCDCICGGKNHGVGLYAALENTKTEVDEWLEDYTQRKGLTDHETEVNPFVYQLQLPI